MTGINQPSTKRGEETFKKIIVAAENLFHEQGYHLTTIADIAKRAKVAVGTFYIYAEDKYALYKKIMMDYSIQIRNTLSKAIEHIPTRKEQERIGIRSFIKYVRDNPHAYTIIWQALQVDKQLFVNYYKDFARHYSRAIAVSQRRGQMKPFDELTVAYTLMGISNFVGLQVIMFEEGLTDDKTIDAMVDQVIAMIDKGLFIE